MTTVLYFPKTEEEEEKNEIFWRNQASCNKEEWKWLSWSCKKEIRERRGRKNCFMTWCDWNWDHVAVLFLPLLFRKRQFPLKEKTVFHLPPSSFLFPYSEKNFPFPLNSFSTTRSYIFFPLLSSPVVAQLKKISTPSLSFPVFQVAKNKKAPQAPEWLWRKRGKKGWLQFPISFVPLFFVSSSLFPLCVFMVFLAKWNESRRRLRPAKCFFFHFKLF